VAPKPALRVFVADADRCFTDRIQAALSHEPHIVVVGRASDADEAVALVRSRAPDLVFIALDMPGAFTATRHILCLTPRPPRVVVLAPDRDGGHRRRLAVGGSARAMSGPPGVSGYVKKTEADVEIVALVAALSELSARASVLTNGR
jgi:DNA-binding NarL/FixJ family response regulator